MTPLLLLEPLFDGGYPRGLPSSVGAIAGARAPARAWMITLELCSESWALSAQTWISATLRMTRARARLRRGLLRRDLVSWRSPTMGLVASRSAFLHWGFVTAPVFSQSRCEECGEPLSGSSGFFLRGDWASSSCRLLPSRTSARRTSGWPWSWYVQPTWLALVPCFNSPFALVCPKCLSGAGSRRPTAVTPCCSAIPHIRSLHALLVRFSECAVCWPDAAASCPLLSLSRQVPKRDDR